MAIGLRGPDALREGGWINIVAPAKACRDGSIDPFTRKMLVWAELYEVMSPISFYFLIESLVLQNRN